MKEAAQARDHAPAHEARADLSGENRLLVRSDLIRGAHVRGWPQLLAVQSRLAKKNAALLKRRAQLLKKKQTSHSRQRRSDR